MAAPRRACEVALRRDDDQIGDLRSEYRDLQLARLERIHLRLWRHAFGAVPNLAAVDRLLKMYEREAKLLGLDAQPFVPATSKTMAEIYVLLDNLEASFAALDRRGLPQPVDHPEHPDHRS